MGIDKLEEIGGKERGFLLWVVGCREKCGSSGARKSYLRTRFRY